MNACFKVEQSCYAVGNNGTILSKNQERIRSQKIISEKMPVSIKVFPDPCDDVLNILLPGEGNVSMKTITVSNISGQVLIQKQVSDLSGIKAYPLPVSELRNGIYLLRIASGPEATTIRFVVEH